MRIRNKKVLIIFFCFVISFCLLSNRVTAIYISSCTVISSPGTYLLNTNIINSSSSICMNISANNVILDCQGYTIDGTDTSKTYGIYIYRSSSTNTNITIKNCILTDWYYGIWLNYSSNNTIINSTFNSNSVYGIYLSNSSNNIIINSNASLNLCGILLHYSSNNTIINSTFNSNSIYYGIWLHYSSNNTIINSNASSNSNGIYLYYSSNNTIYNNIIQNNSNYGIYLASASGNLIYNNLFNNTNNFYFDGTIYSNYWNTTRQEGKRIYSNGNEIGGNYWTNSTGNGYSDTCTDNNYDGFCDSNYTLNTSNIDYLPLTKVINLEVNLSHPPSYYEIVRGKSFQVNASFKCKSERGCKNSFATLRYNSSSPYPDTKISETQDSTPFYILPSTLRPIDYECYAIQGAGCGGGDLDPPKAYDGNEDTYSQIYTLSDPSSMVSLNYTIFAPWNSLTLFIKIRSGSVTPDAHSYIRLYNFSSKNWFVWNSSLLSLGTYSIPINYSSGLISSGRKINLNFYLNESFTIMNIYEIYVIGFSNPAFCGDLQNEETCNITWLVNATGNFDTFWNIDVLFNSSTQNIFNDTSDSLIKIIPGIWEVKLTVPGQQFNSFRKYSNFTVSGYAKCLEGVCGEIIATVKYNSSSPYPDTKISETQDSTPFYTSSSTKNCSSNLQSGSICSVSWTINATGNKYTYWTIGITFNSTLLGTKDTNSIIIEIFPESCSKKPFVIDGKLRVMVECEGGYYSFAKTKNTFNLPIELKVHALLNSSSTKNWMLGLGNGNIDNYGRPENSFAFEFNETHIKFMKYYQSVPEELGNSEEISTSYRLGIELNSSNITFIVNDRRFEFPFFSPVNKWYFFIDAYDSKDTIVDIDNVRIRKYYIPEPEFFVDFNKEEKIEVKRLGLASIENKPNLLSLEKIKRLNDICSSGGYNSLKTNFGLDAEFYLTIRRIEDNSILLACGMLQSGESSAYIERIVALDDGTHGKLELRVWK